MIVYCKWQQQARRIGIRPLQRCKKMQCDTLLPRSVPGSPLQGPNLAPSFASRSLCIISQHEISARDRRHAQSASETLLQSLRKHVHARSDPPTQTTDVGVISATIQLVVGGGGSL